MCSKMPGKIQDILQNTTPACTIAISSQKADILAAVEELVEAGAGTGTASSQNINATWKLLWTTEKETLFILKQARWFGTEAGDVYQVVDVPGGALNNVITFQNGAAFIVDSSLDLDADNPQRLNFKFSGAKLKLPKRTVSLPPFGKGWFDTVYLGNKIRVAKDIRGDTLVVERDGAPRSFE
ncbi:g2911 [Coccomyxa viridis]|uniref:G2911 protein n=1 Tax=Coccomyxa viridis TaxID=1274662 RepID=A0ABP1FLJ1_9CHLO